jgi:hypothetical protein
LEKKLRNEAQSGKGTKCFSLAHRFKPSTLHFVPVPCTLKKMNLQHITEQVALLTRKTALFVKEAASEFSRDSIEYKGLNDLVSYVDKETEIRLVEGLRQILPEAGFIAEEGTAERTEDQEYAWIVDLWTEPRIICTVCQFLLSRLRSCTTTKL